MTSTQTRVAQLCRWVGNEMQFIFICKYSSKLEGFVWEKSAGGDQWTRTAIFPLL